MYLLSNSWLPVVILAFLGFTPSRAEAGPLYTVTNLGTLGGTVESRALSINASGQVVGFSRIAGDTTDHAFLWQNGVMADLGTLPGGIESTAFGINHSGEVVGRSSLPGGLARAFLWQNGAMTDLGNLGYPYSVAQGINDSGQVVGVSVTTELNIRAFLWQNGVMTDLGTLPGGLASNAFGLNASAQVVGRATTTVNTIEHAFLWQNGVMTDLGTLPGGIGFQSFAVAINNVGQVVGFSDSPGGRHAFLWHDGAMADLGTLGGTESLALGINTSGQVVGFSSLAGGDYAAFLYEGEQLIDLNTRLVPGSGNWFLTQAYAINDTGQIVGEGIFEGQQRAFLLTPVKVTTVAIDIKPGSRPNNINPHSREKIPVAILTTGAFDATTVDSTTVFFGATGTQAAPVQSALEDVNGDGNIDMILHFNTQDTGIACGATSASLTGETISGQVFQGSDSINTVGCK